MKQILYERRTDEEGNTLREGRIVRLEIPHLSDSEDDYGRTLAYVYTDADNDGEYDHLFNRDLLALGLARTSDFPHTYTRDFSSVKREAQRSEVGLWGACPAPNR